MFGLNVCGKGTVKFFLSLNVERKFLQSVGNARGLFKGRKQIVDFKLRYGFGG